MPLARCPECKTWLTPEMKACPNCGYPTDKHYLVQKETQDMKNLYHKAIENAEEHSRRLKFLSTPALKRYLNALKFW